MKRVPPEIDALMWRLAEESHPVAQAEFEARHARYGPELARRIRMVSELRQAGKAAVHRPAFTPRPARIAPMRRGVVGAAMGLAILAVGAVAYVVASGGSHPEPLVRAIPPFTSPVPSVPPSIPEPSRKVARTPSTISPTPEVPKPATTATSVPTDLQVKDTELTAAIMLVAKAGNLNVTVAPGFPDRKVTFDYGTMSPLDTLKTMGEENGFSVIEEGEGEFLVVPARDKSPDRRIGI